MKQRTNYSTVDLYDWIRILATIFVVIGHSSYLQVESYTGQLSFSLPTKIADIWYSPFFESMNFISQWVYGFHMPLFFFLSGAVLGIKPIDKLSTFIIKKFKRLLIPYFGVSYLFVIPLLYISGYYYYSNEQLVKTLPLVITGHESNHLWFIFALFWTMVIFAFLQKFIEKFISNNYILLLIITLIIQIIFFHVPDIFKFSTGMIHIFWFAAGYLFEKKLRIYFSTPLAITLLFITTILEFINYSAIGPLFHTHFVYIVGIIWTMSLSYILSIVLIPITNTKIFEIIKRNLFNIYLFHVPLETLTLKIIFNSTLVPYNLLETNLGCCIYLFVRTLGVTITSILIGETLRAIKKVCF